MENIFESVTGNTHNLRPSAWVTLRTIHSRRGTSFDVFAETDHYVMCHEPINSDTAIDALGDLDDLAKQGYFLCNHNVGPGSFIVFEKRIR